MSQQTTVYNKDVRVNLYPITYSLDSISKAVTTFYTDIRETMIHTTTVLLNKTEEVKEPDYSELRKIYGDTLSDEQLKQIADVDERPSNNKVKYFIMPSGERLGSFLSFCPSQGKKEMFRIYQFPSADNKDKDTGYMYVNPIDDKTGNFGIFILNEYQTKGIGICSKRNEAKQVVCSAVYTRNTDGCHGKPEVLASFAPNGCDSCPFAPHNFKEKDKKFACKLTQYLYVGLIGKVGNELKLIAPLLFPVNGAWGTTLLKSDSPLKSTIMKNGNAGIALLNSKMTVDSKTQIKSRVIEMTLDPLFNSGIVLPPHVRKLMTTTTSLLLPNFVEQVKDKSQQVDTSFDFTEN